MLRHIMNSYLNKTRPIAKHEISVGGNIVLVTPKRGAKIGIGNVIAAGNQNIEAVTQYCGCSIFSSNYLELLYIFLKQF